MSLTDLMTGHWAIEPDTLRELQSVYATHLRGEKIDIKAIEARLGRPLANEQQRYTVEPGGVAVLRASGIMAPKANLLMQVSGGVSTQMLTAQFESMAADTRVRSVVFAPDSPGGNVLGIPAAAKALAALAAIKPTVTVVEGVMASAMYWVGSAANAVYVEGETDVVGSLGVIKRISWDKADPNSMEFVRGRYKLAGVNGQPPTAEVVAYHDAQMDYLYTLLIDTVAQHRGTTSQQVLERMADGRVFIGQQGITAGLVDGVSTVNAMVDQLATNPAPYASRRKAVFAVGAGSSESASAGAAPQDDTTTTEKGFAVANQTPSDQSPTLSRESFIRDHAALFAALRDEHTAAGATAERARIQGVLAQSKLMPGHDALVQRLAFDGATTPEQAAMALLQAEGAAREAAARAFQADAPAAAAASALPDTAAGAGAVSAEAAAAAASHSIAARAVALARQLRNPTRQGA